MSSISSSTSATPSASSSVPATPASSSAAALPNGCSPSSFPGPGKSGTITASFAGCVVGIASVLPTCCTVVGSTPVFVNDTCGCPFSASFPSTAFVNFLNCADENNATAICGPTPKNNSPTGVRLNFAAMVLGMACVLGVVGL
ncbi:hypothetical protein C8R43DRAFT_1116052 [Mycena crocata]|nr:hypothetical protein C8R43DRAFT_1116052 [Mycena crocata]